MKTLLVLLGCCLSATHLYGGSKNKTDERDLYLKENIEIHIVKTQSLEADVGIRVPRGVEAYRVVAYSTNIPPTSNPGPQVNYVLACPEVAPEVGKIYFAHDEYVSPPYSLLRLSPVERKSLGLDGKGRMYHVIQISDVKQGQKSDIACDVYSATAAAER